MKKILLSVIIGLSSISMWAVPAYPGKILATQPDGSTLEIQLHGDEHFSYTTTTNGYLIQKNNEGYYEYATAVSGIIVPSGIRVHNAIWTDTNRFKIENNLSGLKVARTNRIAAVQKEKTYKVPRNETELADKGIVILVNFADVKFTVPNPREAYDSLLNYEGYSKYGALGSARDYFYASSMGQYDPTFHVYGPYDLPNNMKYYGEHGPRGQDQRANEMVIDAVKLLDEDAEAGVDFSEYDQDGDGYVDFIFIYYAGYNEAESLIEETVWPHQSNIQVWPSGDRTNEYDGKMLGDYACTSEFRGSSGEEMCGRSTFCHEFSHVLGLMDMYDTQYSEGIKTLGDWDIMDQGSYNHDGRIPPVYNAFERFTLGWLTPEVITPGSYTLEDILTSNKAYVISSSSSEEIRWNNKEPYYIFETRAREDGTWDEYIPGYGMLIYKITYNESNWENNLVNSNKAMGVDLIEANGNTSIKDGSRFDPFPGLGKITDFNAFDRLWLSNITFDDNTGTVTFNVKATSVGVENVFENQGEIFIAGSTVYGLEAGMELRCIDMAGRTLWTDTALADTYRFDMPQGLYCIIVSQDGMQRKVLKSVGK